ncbi:ABC transporter ATP-binding protein [Synechococcus sp. Nb3U1]|uniref:ABC transporter ATP-binding protein n=1 Tax=Synechococcus sp. Nb3U1 TaxID=1914529 RepID=UPI001F3362BF|nr:ABC transporter ATP-binding protein [Synechococcus sp. Nb3U1]MCF2971328.1 ABC transporter ATP-binding protein [Synechococcus sp. Nb3U1]
MGQGIPAAVEMSGIVKRFGPVVANAGIDLRVESGEIHALLGENGAGKSTLMAILYGWVSPDAGTIRIDGIPVRFRNPRDAVAAGLGMVHQHFLLIPRFSVAENIILGAEPQKGIRLDRHQAVAQVEALMQAQGLWVDPWAKVADLPVGMQQRVELLKALYRGSRILILDEPTALLAPTEVEEFYQILRRLRANGQTILFITHKLQEVLTVSDRLTVIRQGRTVGSCTAAEATPGQLAEMMVGRSLSLGGAIAPAAVGGDPLLEVDQLALRPPSTPQSGHPQEGIQLQVCAGEIVGICGVEGNGQTELLDLLMGHRHSPVGTVKLRGRDISHFSPLERRRLGLRTIPPDRHQQGLVLNFSLLENLLLTHSEDPPLARRVRLNYARAQTIAQELLHRFDVRAPSTRLPARTLSGGNQQKWIIARELWGDPCLLLAAQPTRGLDIGATEFVHERLREARARGCGILLISFDLDEVLALSDRILVLFRGQISGEFARGAASRQALGLLMSGGQPG